jgi:hypothetical protein
LRPTCLADGLAPKRSPGSSVSRRRRAKERHRNMTKRIPIVVMAVSALAGLVSAQTMTREEAQKKVDEAKKASCEIVKKQVASEAAKCPEEAAAAAKIDCADIASYKTNDMMKLNQGCIDKWSVRRDKAASKSGSSGAATKEAKPKVAEPKAAAAKKDETASAKTHKCRALEKDQVIAEAEGDGVSVCYDALKAKLKESKCGPATTKYAFKAQYRRTSNTSWSDSIDLAVYCGK